MTQRSQDKTQKRTAPMLGVAEIQARTAQKLFQEQAQLMQDCLQISTQYTTASDDQRDMGAYLRAPLAISQQLQERFQDFILRQWEILGEARSEMGDVTNSAAETLNSEMAKVTGKSQKRT